MNLSLMSSSGSESSSPYSATIPVLAGSEMKINQVPETLHPGLPLSEHTIRSENCR